MLEFTIELQPITKKNHQTIKYNPLKKKPYIGNSPQYMQYAKAAGAFIAPVPDKPIKTAVNVQCTFYMKDKKRTDLVNLLQAVDDILVKYHVLADDNYTIVARHDGSQCRLDRKHPRTEIVITELPTTATENGGEKA